MLLRTIAHTLLIIAAVLTVPAAKGAWKDSAWNYGAGNPSAPKYNPGRHLGIFWGDGYHSRTACPPRQSAWRATPVRPAEPLPWWATPAPPAEQLPAAEPTPASPIPPAGTSLFRQPGEGTTITR